MRNRDHTLAVRALLYALGAALLAASPLAHAAEPARVLDDFESAAGWSVFSSTQVTGAIRVSGDAADGKALCLDYDFHGVSGYVGIRRALPLDYPADYAFDFQLRGASPPNNLEFKLVDASGDNVWWVQRANYAFPRQWTGVRYRKRHVSKAWGPSPETELKHSASLEFTLASGSGGKGSVCFDRLRFTPLVPDDGSPLAGTRRLSGDSLVIDLGRAREYGGLSLLWPGAAARSYEVLASDDGGQWRPLRKFAGDGGEDWIALPESESRFLKIAAPGAGRDLGQLQVTVEPLAFGANPNAFLMEIAKRAPRGEWPRGFRGEQAYWTIVGVDGGARQALLSEDGAIELGKGGPSVEPFLYLDGKRLGWAEAKSSQSLQDGYLPIPSVALQFAQAKLVVTAFAEGEPENARLLARYRVQNTSARALDLEFALALRPMQVNPPSQFLNTAGGFSPLRAIDAHPEGAMASDFHAGILWPNWKLGLLQKADDASGFTLDGGGVRAIPFGTWPRRRTSVVSLDDREGHAGVAWRYRLHLAPGESREFGWWSSLATRPEGASAPTDLAALQARSAAEWHRRLDAVKFSVPARGQRMVETLRYALATMLVSRTGPRLQPGTRSYARAWIRDGAMIDEALLRLGREDVAREFVDWYAPYQFDDGKVPCCVDDRGSDPVPENDSHGELVYAIAEVYRYTRDRAFLERHWPRVQKAVAYMDQLRASERTQEGRTRNPSFHGLMPASISHEGYSAKPMHSYWDDFWALRGYKDAVRIAQWLGHEDEAKRIAAARDEFAADLKASLALATASKGLDFVPGSAELGDFDPTSTTIALAPADAADLLPPGLLDKGFERYWSESQARAAGTRAWKDYTPYELRTVGTFVRLGLPERAHAMLDFFFRDQQPAGWRQWAEVVSSTPRQPFFLGDLPHAWVASDYARSALDLFAYERGDQLVLAAGIPLSWLDGEGVAVDGLRTPYGPLGWSLRKDGDELLFELKAGTATPPGGFVLSLPQARIEMARINGRWVKSADHEVRLPNAPVHVRLKWRPAVYPFSYDKFEGGGAVILCYGPKGTDTDSGCSTPAGVEAALLCNPTRSRDVNDSEAFRDCLQSHGLEITFHADVMESIGPRECRHSPLVGICPPPPDSD